MRLAERAARLGSQKRQLPLWSVGYHLRLSLVFVGLQPTPNR